VMPVLEHRVEVVDGSPSLVAFLPPGVSRWARHQDIPRLPQPLLSADEQGAISTGGLRGAACLGRWPAASGCAQEHTCKHARTHACHPSAPAHAAICACMCALACVLACMHARMRAISARLPPPPYAHAHREDLDVCVECTDGCVYVFFEGQSAAKADTIALPGKRATLGAVGDRGCRVQVLGRGGDPKQ